MAVAALIRHGGELSIFFSIDQYRFIDDGDGMHLMHFNLVTPGRYVPAVMHPKWILIACSLDNVQLACPLYCR